MKRKLSQSEERRKKSKSSKRSRVNRNWELLTRATEGKWKNDYSFVVIGDPQLGMWNEEADSWEEDADSLRRCVEEINKLRPKPKFVCVLGDLVHEFPHKSLEKHARQMDDFEDLIIQLDEEIEIFAICGNHDLGNKPTTDSIGRFEERFGRSYFSFWIGGVKYVMFNSQMYENGVEVPKLFKTQDEWLREQMISANEENPAHTVLFCHIPPFAYSRDEKKGYFNFDRQTRDKVCQLAKTGGVRVWFTGHFHRNAIGVDPEGLEIVVSSASGTVLSTENPTTSSLNLKGLINVGIGENSSGFRVVKVEKEKITHQYFVLGKYKQPINTSNISTPTSNMALTEFEGYSLWLELPDLQNLIYLLSEKYELFNFPGHCTLLYNFTSDEDEARETFSKFKDTVRKISKSSLSLKPKSIEHGRSSKFPHLIYLDIMYEKNKTLAKIYEAVSSGQANPWADSPHACLAYANPNKSAVSAFADGSIAKVVEELFPDLYEGEWSPYRFSLWKTKGRTSDWKRIDSIILHDEREA